VGEGVLGVVRREAGWLAWQRGGSGKGRAEQGRAGQSRAGQDRLGPGVLSIKVNPGSGSGPRPRLKPNTPR
jgi:hypothetical protein